MDGTIRVSRERPWLLDGTVPHRNRALFKESQRALKRKGRDMNVVHAKERSRLREHLSSLRSKGMSVLSSSSSVFNGAHSSSTTRASTANATVSSSSSDALTILRKSLESSLGLRAGGDSSVGMGSSFSPSNSALPRAATAGSGVIRGGRRKQVRGTGRRRNRRRQQQQQGEKQSNSDNFYMVQEGILKIQTKYG